MAPEQIKGCYGPEVDIWSAGVVMYLAMGGVHPFWASSREAVKDAILSKEASFKYGAWLAVSNECKDCIASMLLKEPLKRATARDVLGECAMHPTSWLEMVLWKGADSCYVCFLTQGTSG